MPSPPAAFSRSAFGALAFLAAGFGLARAGESSPSSYRPQPVDPPKDASYVLSDGSIYVAGNDLVAPYLERLNGVFEEAHPGFRFKMDLYASALAISGITSGKSAFGPMGRDATFVDIAAFTARYGYPPTDVQIGWDNTPDSDHFPPNGKFPPAVWVNSRNPIPSLSVEEAMSIFTTGSPRGDITHWGQIAGDEGPVGANGADWAKRAIHVYLPALRGLPIISTTRMRFHGLRWSPRAEFLPMMEDVVNAVANDPFGIGFIGWWPDDEGWDRQAELGSKVRLMPLAPDKDSKVSHAGPGDLYPLAGGIHLFVNRPPGKSLEPWLREYLRLALSKEGQDILASFTKSDGFIPLDPDDVPRELAKIE
jgi:phosphate transport system substrate-binding protein